MSTIASDPAAPNAASRTSKGRAIHNFLELPTDENVSAIVAYPETKKKQESMLVMVTKDGIRTFTRYVAEEVRDVERHPRVLHAADREEAELQASGKSIQELAAEEEAAAGVERLA